MTFAAHRARKRFGQHWLNDAAVLRRIVAAADLQPGESVLEVEPGRGALTEQLLASPAALVQAVELDRDLVVGLAQRFGVDPRFSLLEGDALAVPLPAATKVVANIPYNITGPLLERLVGRLEKPIAVPYQRLVLLVQQEVGQRIRARPGSSAFSALSVRMQLLAHCRTVCPGAAPLLSTATEGALGGDRDRAAAAGATARSRPRRRGGQAAAALLHQPPQDAAQQPGRPAAARGAAGRGAGGGH